MIADPHAAARAAGRHSVAFLLDQIRASAEGRHFLEYLILLTIIQANVAHLDRDPELQRAFSRYDTPPPDHVRRPISVSAIANALRIPYETARRRVQQLVDRGDCVPVHRGLIVPARALQNPKHEAAIKGTYRNVRQLYLNLRPIGVLRNLPAPNAPATPEPMRALARLSSDYCLRLVDILTTHVGDLTSGVLLLQILHANIRHIDSETRDAVGEGALMPDALRRPVAVSQLADELGIAPETARRHASKLVAEQRAIRWPGGLLVPSASLTGEPWPQLIMDNLGHVNRMFAALAQLGLLAEWDRAASAASGAA